MQLANYSRAYGGYAVFPAGSGDTHRLVPGRPGTSSATMRKRLSLFSPKPKWASGAGFA